MKPSLGRIVLASVEARTNNGLDVAPAIVTRVFDNGLINVRVLGDNGNPPAWLTSVTLYDDEAGFQQARKTRDEMAPEFAGQSIHAAYWPPHV